MKGVSPLKHFIHLFIFSFFAACCYGQEIEIKLNVYTGLFSFRGSAATSLSTFISNDMGYHNPTSYGKKSSFSYGYGAQAQRVTKSKVLFGVGLAYENLKSKAGIDSVYFDIGGRKATGEVILSNTFIVITPFIGHRFHIG